MDIDECSHEWDFTINEYVPVIESIRKHHPCKECGVINYRPEMRQLKTGDLIVLIKEMCEKCDLPSSRIRGHIEQIKQMKRDGVLDDVIIDTVMSEALYGRYQ